MTRFLFRAFGRSIKTAVFAAVLAVAVSQLGPAWLGDSILQTFHGLTRTVPHLLAPAPPSVGSHNPSTLTLHVPTEASLVRVLDGDTIDAIIRRQLYRVRLAAIDAPENGQDFGHESTHILAGLIAFHPFTVTITDFDRHGRAIAWITTDQGCVNTAMVRAGAAWHFHRYDQSPALAHAMREAQRERRGLWAFANPTPPWEFRRR